MQESSKCGQVGRVSLLASAVVVHVGESKEEGLLPPGSSAADRVSALPWDARGLIEREVQQSASLIGAVLTARLDAFVVALARPDELPV